MPFWVYGVIGYIFLTGESIAPTNPFRMWAWSSRVIIVCVIVLEAFRRLAKKFPVIGNTQSGWKAVMSLCVGLVWAPFAWIGTLVLSVNIWASGSMFFRTINNWLGLPEIGFQRLIVNVVVVYLLHQLFTKLKIYERILPPLERLRGWYEGW